MSKLSRSKRVIQARKAEPRYSDRVYWGLVGDGDGPPEMLVTDRKYAEAWKGALPPEHRAKVSIVRTYVTVWRLDRAPRRRARPNGS